MNEQSRPHRLNTDTILKGMSMYLQRLCVYYVHAGKIIICFLRFQIIYVETAHSTLSTHCNATDSMLNSTLAVNIAEMKP